MSLSFCPLIACHSSASEPAPAGPATIEVRDDKGGVTAELRPSHPCRARIGPIELQIGGPPLVSQLGETRLTGSDASNGTTLDSDGQVLARVLPSGDGRAIDVFDPLGAVLVRIDTDGAGATVSTPSQRVLHRIAPGGGNHVLYAGHADDLVLDGGDQVVHGTHDAVLAALFVAPEIVPEVRMLAGCERAWGGK
jgi:hypothetical protein